MISRPCAFDCSSRKTCIVKPLYRKPYYPSNRFVEARVLAALAVNVGNLPVPVKTLSPLRAPSRT